MNNHIVVICTTCGRARIKEQQNTDGSQWHIPTHAWACTDCMKLSNKQQMQRAYNRHWVALKNMEKQGVKK